MTDLTPIVLLPRRLSAFAVRTGIVRTRNYLYE